MLIGANMQELGVCKGEGICIDREMCVRGDV